MHELTLCPTEVLYKKGECDNRIYYVNRGVLESFIELIYNEKEVTIATIEVKNYFYLLFFRINFFFYYKKLIKIDWFIPRLKRIFLRILKRNFYKK